MEPIQLDQWKPGDECLVPTPGDPSTAFEGRIYKLYRDQGIAVVRCPGSVELRVKISELLPRKAAG